MRPVTLGSGFHEAREVEDRGGSIDCSSFKHGESGASWATIQRGLENESEDT